MSLSLRKKVSFALLVVVAFFGALEMVLAAFGWRPAAESQDPYVGFAGNSALFVQAKSNNGTVSYTTAQNKLRWFNPQSFPVAKSPNTVRIFCLGGSTTYGHPYDDQTSFAGWLRELLPHWAKSKNWEVVNCGGISYASYRVANVLQELLNYEPDLFVIYTGHNEFLEARSYESLAQTPSLVLRLGNLATHTRIYTLFSRVLDAARKPTSKLRDPSGTLLPGEVNTLLDSSVGLEVYHRDDRYRAKVFEHFAFNLQRMVQMANQHGAKVILVTPASNLGDCAPFKSEMNPELTGIVRQEWLAAWERAQQMFAERSYGPALVPINRCIELDSRHAGSYYLRGRILQALGDFPRAKRDFLKAREEDLCTLRAPQGIIEIVRKTAQEHRVPLVDFVKWADENSENGIPNDQLFLDHVHGTIDAYRHLADQLVAEIRPLGLASDWATPPPREIEAVVARVMSQIDNAEHGVALRNISKVYSWAGKKEDADRVALRALELIPNDADTVYQAANAHVRMGNIDEGIRLYLRVGELEPNYAVSVHSALGFAYGLKGDKAKNLEHYLTALKLNPNKFDVHYNVATIYEDEGDLTKAVNHYRSAISGSPHHYFAQYRLGMVYLRQENWEPARKQFLEAAQLNPNASEPRIGLARALAPLGRKQAAREQLIWVLEREPMNMEAREEIGRLE